MENSFILEYSERWRTSGNSLPRMEHPLRARWSHCDRRQPLHHPRCLLCLRHRPSLPDTTQFHRRQHSQLPIVTTPMRCREACSHRRVATSSARSGFPRTRFSTTRIQTLLATALWTPPPNKYSFGRRQSTTTTCRIYNTSARSSLHLHHPPAPRHRLLLRSASTYSIK